MPGAGNVGKVLIAKESEGTLWCDGSVPYLTLIVTGCGYPDTYNCQNLSNYYT